jgi:peroxiredoxin
MVWAVTSAQLQEPLLALASEGTAAPRTGDAAPDFTLPTTGGNPVRLSSLLSRGPVVLVVLRGYPGYQCPICNRQVQQFLSNAAAFAEAGAQVLFVYPGPSEGLDAKAGEFVADKKLPPHFRFALDPDYSFTTSYRLRWNAPRETAYPSTFVLDRNGKVMFAKTSNSHGGRVSASDVLGILAQLKTGGK